MAWTKGEEACLWTSGGVHIPGAMPRIEGAGPYWHRRREFRGDVVLVQISDVRLVPVEGGHDAGGGNSQLHG